MNPLSVAPAATSMAAPFVKLTKDAGPVSLMAASENAVTPLRMAPPVTTWTPGPRRKPPKTRAPLSYWTVPSAPAVRLPEPGWTMAPLNSSVPPVTLYPPVLDRWPVSVSVPAPIFMTVPGPSGESAIEPTYVLDVLSLPMVKAGPPAGSVKKTEPPVPALVCKLPAVTVPPSTVTLLPADQKFNPLTDVADPPFVTDKNPLPPKSDASLPPTFKLDRLVHLEPAPVTVAVPVAPLKLPRLPV